MASFVSYFFFFVLRGQTGGRSNFGKTAEKYSESANTVRSILSVSDHHWGDTGLQPGSDQKGERDLSEISVTSGTGVGVIAH